MPKPWIVDECQHQLALALAMVAWRQRSGIPEPLIPKASPVAEAIRAGASAARDGLSTADAILGLVRSAFADRSGEAATLPTQPWTVAQLIEWWLRAAEVLDAWDADRRREAERLLECEGGRQHPIVWSAQRRSRLRFGIDEFHQQLKARAQSWQAAPSELSDVLGELFRWVTKCDRPGMPPTPSWAGTPAWMETVSGVFADIEDDCRSLFGDVVRTERAEPLSWETRQEWTARWVGAPIGDQATHEVRRPVVVATGGARRVLVKGFAIVTLPMPIVAQVTKLSASRGAVSPSVDRAVAAAAPVWRDVSLLSNSLKDACAGTPPPSPLALMNRFFLPAARCLVAGFECERRVSAHKVDGVPSDSSDALGAQLALSLALDGFDLQPSGDGQDDWRRSLPSRLPLSQAGSRQYAFVHGRSGVQMPVGTFGEPAVCDEGMLAAIEAVDWRLWAYASALHVCGDATLGKIVQSIVDAAKLADWERLKCGVLRKPEVDELARLFDHVHTRRLSMELLREKVLTSGIDVPMLPELVGEYAVLAQSVLSRLAAADPQELTRLVPPRLVDGGVDVMAWLHAERGASASSASWSMAWVPNERPLGTVVTERREGWRYVVLVSAGAAADCDRALLALPTFVAADTASPRSLANALHVFQTAVVRAFVADAKADVRPALEALRGVLADERAAAFHELVERWRSGDAAVGEWLQTLLADPRFRFVCHPGIDIESKSVVAASATDPYLDWVFDDHVPAGGDVAITFAMNPRRARRRMSRGRRVAGSPADLVDAVVACAGEHGPIADCAVAARRAQDLWVQFPNSAPHPIATAKRLLDGLLGADAASPEVRSEVFAAARRWIATLGHDVVPATWSPDGLVTPEDVGSQELAHEFHRDVPPGSVIVTGFGLRGPCGEPFEGALSAGPPPVGVGALQDAIAGLAALGSEWGAVSLRVADLAKHALANTQRLAASNLYDAFWEAAATTSPPEHQARIEAAKTALFEFVKAAGGMVPFEPSAVGDYPTGWIRESDGKQPRGRRIRRVVRPGLRTIDNALVRPALVITE